MKFRNLLFVDDDVDDLELIKSAMQRISPTPSYSTVNNPVTAFKKLEAKEILPDLIFLDLNMPLISGLEFLEKLKKKDELKNIPVFILSTTSNPTAIKNTMDLGANGFITKPISFSELVECIKSVLFG